MTVPKQRRNDLADEEPIHIRLSDVGRFLKNSRLAVLGWALLFLGLGAVYVFFKQDKYTATVRVMPELKGASGAGGLSDLKALAGFAGVGLDNAMAPEAIRPDLYPDIVQSIPFTLHLLSQPVVMVGETKPYSLQQYLAEQAQKSLMGRLRGGQSVEKVVPPGAPTLRLTRLQEGLSKELNQRVTAVIDKKSGIITITSVMPDPMVAALVAQQTLTHLTEYVTNYRTSKARQQVRFLTQQVNNARRRYQAAEYGLSRYRDLNRSLFLNTAKIEEQRLQADFLLAQTVYNDLSKQLEQARIKVQEEAPVFEVLEPAHLPLRKSGLSGTIILAGFTIFGAVFGLGVFAVRRVLTRKFIPVE